MKPQIVIAVTLVLLTMLFAGGLGRTSAGMAPPLETRCGWFTNPTPANIWLLDREAEWTIGVQGGYQVPDDWPWPKFAKGQWVETNGHHGYGCACLKVRVDKETHHVTEIKSAIGKTLTQCRRDAALKKWDRNLE